MRALEAGVRESREDALAQIERAGIVHDKGLKRSAVGMFESVCVGVASTAPAYSMAATLGLSLIHI